MSNLKHDVAEPDPLCLGDDPCVCEQLAQARAQSYREGFNAHARAAATGYQMFGIPTNQHGEGTNP